MLNKRNAKKGNGSSTSLSYPPVASTRSFLPNHSCRYSRQQDKHPGEHAFTGPPVVVGRTNRAHAIQQRRSLKGSTPQLHHMPNSLHIDLYHSSKLPMTDRAQLIRDAERRLLTRRASSSTPQHPDQLKIRALHPTALPQWQNTVPRYAMAHLVGPKRLVSSRLSNR